MFLYTLELFVLTSIQDTTSSSMISYNYYANGFLQMSSIVAMKNLRL